MNAQKIAWYSIYIKDENGTRYFNTEATEYGLNSEINNMIRKIQSGQITQEMKSKESLTVEYYLIFDDLYPLNPETENMSDEDLLAELGL